MTTKHTPGPWIIDTATRPVEVCTVHNVTSQPTEDGLGQKWVYVRGKLGYWSATPEENFANARLIAAAPNLLAVVECFIDQWDRGLQFYNDHDGEEFLITKARHAARKARTGRAR